MSRAIPLLALRAFMAYKKSENLPAMIKSLFVQTQPNFIYYTELHVSTYLGAYSVHRFFFKTQ